ncbi:MAG: GMC family oxidoreductase [Candidatus Omnitrophica bacterium]|nr:GMC family oxidoreductase [Candidatus Omnitrophota bacterium]MCM8826555.1 GMC family oxidoreductase [Candidatus Omnitrophota bacterium]
MRNKRWRVCIIGAGAGGAIVAYDLSIKGIEVVLIEAGEFWDVSKYYWHPDARSVFTTDMKLEPYLSGDKPFRLERIRGVGGQTIVYNAVSLRYSEFDFRIKNYKGIGEDWPITYKDLEPYYNKLEKELGVSGGRENLEDLPCGEYLPPIRLSKGEKLLKKTCDRLGVNLIPTRKAINTRSYDNRPPCIFCSRCVLGCRIGAKGSTDFTHIPKALATKKCKLITNAMAKEILSDKRGLVKGVVYVDKNTGKEKRIDCDICVLACGAVETPRLLLNSKSKLFPAGLANNSRNVGKYLMENTMTVLAGLLPIGEKIKAPLGVGTQDNSLIPDFYKEGFHFQVGAQKLDSNFLYQLAMDTNGFGKEHKERIRKMVLEGVFIALVGFGEIMPYRENRVEVDNEVKDYWGIPVPKIYMDITSYETDIMKKMLDKSNEILQEAKSYKIFNYITKYIPGIVVHQVGTCRMGNDSKTSVVNKYCQAHEVKNLFIADGSVLVTSPAKNPALTIQALASRTADYIIYKMKKGEI